MGKHFEEIWNESERVSLNAFQNEDLEEIASETKQMLQEFMDVDGPEREHYFGEILFRMCWLANKSRLNSYVVLRNTLNGYKIDTYEPDITSE